MSSSESEARLIDVTQPDLPRVPTIAGPYGERLRGRVRPSAEVHIAGPFGTGTPEPRVRRIPIDHFVHDITSMNTTCNLTQIDDARGEPEL